MTEELVVLSPLESAIDEGIGEASGEPPLPEVPAGLHPLHALEEGVLSALQRPPCFVRFSGGRDSSLVLSVASRVARREGLPLPVPITDVFVGSSAADEAEWQRLVLEHLGLRDRIQHEFGAEMNLLGAHAQESIRRHGLIAPAGTHMFIPTFETARGGSVLTGHGGDGLFNAGSFARARAVLGRHERPALRSPLVVGRGIAPTGLRRAVARRRLEGPPTWLTAAALASWKDRQTEEDASEPFRWDRYVRWWARRRYVVLCRQAAALLAEHYDVRVVDPLLDPRFLAAVAHTGGALGWGRRTTALRSLFSDVLPDEVLARSTKAVFTGPYWSGDAREFIETWDGTGLPPELVEVGGLRAVWQRQLPDARSGLLLQAAWAGTLVPDDVKQPLNCRLE